MLAQRPAQPGSFLRRQRHLKLVPPRLAVFDLDEQAAHIFLRVIFRHRDGPQFLKKPGKNGEEFFACGVRS